MADNKISALDPATTPLAGTEVVPVVQSGSTKKVAVSDLTAGRAVSATQYTSTIASGTAPLVVASTTEVANLRAANATSSDTADAVKSNATTGVLQITGPAAATTRVMTTPDANFTAARTDAGQTFTGTQAISGALNVTAPTYATAGGVSNPNDPNDSTLFTLTNGANTNGGIARGGGTALSLIDKTSNSGSGTVGYGLYVAAPYDGTNASGGTYALTKYAIYVDDIYNFYGQNATLGGGNYGLYIKGGGKNYLKADTQFDGNVIIGTSGKGIDFSATPGTGTSELLADYEEGTWTFGLSRSDPSGFTYTAGASDSAVYTKIGRQVFVKAVISGTFSGGAGAYRVTGLPFNTAGGATSYFIPLFANLQTGADGLGYSLTDAMVALNFTPASGDLFTASMTYNA
jgi:hypothetical protein